jgi:hypothetical protein
MYRQSVNPFLEKFPNCPVFIRCSRAVALGAPVAHDTSPTTICSMPSANLPRWLGVDRDGVLSLAHIFSQWLTCLRLRAAKMP